MVLSSIDTMVLKYSIAVLSLLSIQIFRMRGSQNIASLAVPTSVLWFLGGCARLDGNLLHERLPFLRSLASSLPALPGRTGECQPFTCSPTEAHVPPSYLSPPVPPVYRGACTASLRIPVRRGDTRVRCTGTVSLTFRTALRSHGEGEQGVPPCRRRRRRQRRCRGCAR